MAYKFLIHTHIDTNILPKINVGEVKAKMMYYVSFSGFHILPFLFIHCGAVFCEELERLLSFFVGASCAMY